MYNDAADIDVKFVIFKIISAGVYSLKPAKDKKLQFWDSPKKNVGVSRN